MQNQFNCLFLTRKGNCKEKENQENYCKCNLKNLLMQNQNGEANKTNLLIAFLECYQANYEKKEDKGKSFFKVTSKQIANKALEPLPPYTAEAMLDVFLNKKTKNVYMLRMPESWKPVLKAFGATVSTEF